MTSAAATGLLPPSRRRRLLQLWAAITAFFAIRAFADGMLRTAPADRLPPAVSVVIDVNRATVGELTALPGIGRTRAEAIVLHRVRHGPFAGLDQLAGVDGIGPETVAALRPHATVGGER